MTEFEQMMQKKTEGGEPRAGAWSVIAPLCRVFLIVCFSYLLVTGVSQAQVLVGC